MYHSRCTRGTSVTANYMLLLVFRRNPCYIHIVCLYFSCHWDITLLFLNSLDEFEYKLLCCVFMCSIYGFHSRGCVNWFWTCSMEVFLLLVELKYAIQEHLIRAPCCGKVYANEVAVFGMVHALFAMVMMLISQASQLGARSVIDQLNFFMLWPSIDEIKHSFFSHLSMPKAYTTLVYVLCERNCYNHNRSWYDL